MSDTPVEETTRFEPRFGPDGLIPAVVTDAETGQVLMLAWMNAEALARTLEAGEAHFWSRSRAALWRKGETSGETLQVVEVLTDCDQDALLVRARPQGVGATCHTGRRSCFYRVVEADTPGSLSFRDARRLLDPDRVYGRAPSE